jgi:hypothetical protein
VGFEPTIAVLERAKTVVSVEDEIWPNPLPPPQFEEWKGELKSVARMNLYLSSFQSYGKREIIPLHNSLIPVSADANSCEHTLNS